MTEPKITSDVGINQNAILRRYMTLPKLLDLLHSKELYFRRADGFSDRLEGALFPSYRAGMNECHAEGSSEFDANYIYRRARTGNYLSCWTISGEDSMALWQLYGDVRNSVAITTTFGRVLKSSIQWERDVHITRVKYIDHLKVKNYIIGKYRDFFQYKHKAYKHEKELRIIVPQQGENWEANPISIRLPVKDLDGLIRSIVVAPEAEYEYFEAIKTLCLRYDLRSPVRRSKLAFVPV
jgi:hypothetical protein